jgi:xylulokinase
VFVYLGAPTTKQYYIDMYLLGIDVGSSSVKAALVAADTGATVATAQAPATEMPIEAPQPGWAEQSPDIWWQYCTEAVRKVLAAVDTPEVLSIGIAYQMHGLVTLDAAHQIVRPAIIWCDSRAVGIGAAAAESLGADFCLKHYLNTPGNFTASKLRWVQQNEPHLYEKIRYAMLPGDYIGFRLTDEVCTTPSGLSEGVLWDFERNQVAEDLLGHFNVPKNILPEVRPTFGQHGRVHAQAAAEWGIKAGVPVTYRAGDQPNNALALNILEPGEVAATGGTSGVVYGVVDRLAADPYQRVNSFAHVNHTAEAPRVGVLLCINGAGVSYAWARRHMGMTGTPYSELEQLAAQAPAGSDGLLMMPFGNGAERMFNNRNVGAAWAGLDFNRHGHPQVFRSVLEGLGFSFIYGMRLMRDLGLDVSLLRVGNDNLFQSKIFSETIATLMGCRIELLRTNGATGAAIASGVGAGVYQTVREGLRQLEIIGVHTPNTNQQSALEVAYDKWTSELENRLEAHI